MLRARIPNRRGALALGLLTLLATGLMFSPALTAATWHQANKDGFFGNPPDSLEIAQLFAFGSSLYAYDSYGLYRMESSVCGVWKKIYTPVASGSWSFQVLGDSLYLMGKSNDLWMIEKGKSFDSQGWKKVTASGLPSGATVTPMALFQGEVYGMRNLWTTSWAFEIWRSPDLGKATMTWSKVVSNSFGDPNNHDLGFLLIFQNKLHAVTTRVREGLFGSTTQYGSGVEVWASASGNAGSWSQVNQDGWGSEVTVAGQKIRTNPDVGSWVVYQGHLYIGTKSHLGAQVWRYDGTGLGGWVDKTPPGAGPHPFLSSPGRNEAMVVNGGYLYLSEGFPGGGLKRFGGSSWTTVVAGPHPFDSKNGGLGSAVVFKKRLFVVGVHDQGETKGDQVWAHPHPLVALFACQELGWADRYQPLWQISPGSLELVGKAKKSSSSEASGAFDLDVHLDGEPIWSETVEGLAEGEEIELELSFEAEEGDHFLTLVADAEGSVPEADGDDNLWTIAFSVPEDPETTGDGLRIEIGPTYLSDGDLLEVTLSGAAAPGCEPELAAAELATGSRTTLTLALAECAEGEDGWSLTYHGEEPLPALPFLEIQVRSAEDGRMLGTEWLAVRLREEVGCWEDPTTLCLGDGRFRVTSFLGGEEAVSGEVIESFPEAGRFLFPDGEELYLEIFGELSPEGEVGLFAEVIGEGEIQLYVEDTLTGRLLDFWKAQGEPELLIEDPSAFPGRR